MHSFGSSVSTPENTPTHEQVATSMFNKVFGRTIESLESNVLPSLIQIGQYDLLGLLLSIQLTHSMLNLMKERRVPVLDR